MALKGGYMGICSIDGQKIRVSTFTGNVIQEVQFYDHIIGLRDSYPNGLNTKGEGGAINPDTGQINIQKYAWNPGVKLASGTFSFPATVESLQTVYDLVRVADDFELVFNYACNDLQRTFTGTKIAGLDFSITAGDILTLSVEFTALSMTEEENVISKFTESQKLITWDAINISPLNSAGDPLSSNTPQSFNFSVKNDIIPIYTAGANVTNDLFPKKLRVGMQSVTGSLAYFTKGIDFETLDEFTSYATIGIQVEDPCTDTFVEELCVIYKPIERSSSLQALVYPLPFVGVGRALGEPIA